MNHQIDLRRVIKILNITGERLAGILEVSYHDMSSMLRGKKEVSDEMIGRMYRLFGKKIFF